MGACGVAAVVVLLLASALLPSPASSRVLEGEASSSEGAPPPTVAAGGSSKSDKPKDSKLSSTGDSENQGQGGGDGQVSVKSPPPPPPPVKVKDAPKESPPPPLVKVKDAPKESPPPPPVNVKDVPKESPPPPPVKVKDAPKESPPPPPVKEPDVPKESPPPPPGNSGPNGGGDGTDREETGNQAKVDAAEKMKEVMEKCDALHKCSIGEEFSACLQVSNNASIGSFVIVLNKGGNDITVNVKEASNIDIDNNPLPLAKDAFGQMSIRNINPNGGKVTLSNGNGDCVLHVGQSVSDWQQQFQQFAAYATHLNPIYGAYLFGFTVVLVGAVCLCCKFARRRGNGGVPYQQLEMSAPAPNASGTDNTTSTADGWDEGWDDDWDDEEAPARPSDKNAASSVSGNGLSLRSHVNNKDGWDVDWDD
ncbi:hypothetical protein EJB05_36020 [Eragrostis curvula]|uniref:DUF7356 domain-containing protein n=1 Tax=Eragrostis curvula TaxID=38414 RepID=A0A5J9U8B1_9POAL|nr:hypothetical protein EJB05_36020 [Eragrostis curvula]